MTTTDLQPRHRYIDESSRRVVLATFVAHRSEANDCHVTKSTNSIFSTLAGDYNSIALIRYALGYPLDIVANDLRGEVGALREMFRLRGTSRARYYPFVERPAPAEAIARGDPPFFQIAVLGNLSDLGPTDYSETNSREGFLSVCKALIVGDEQAEREFAGMIWDPPGATYLSKNSVVCSFNDQRVAYALKAHYEGDYARFEAELRGLRSPKPNVAAEATMLRAIMGRDRAMFVQGLDALLRWHRREATRDQGTRNDSYRYICVSGLGLARLAIREGICTRHDLPADEPFLPLELFNTGPNARSYTNKILAPFDPKRPEWKPIEVLAPVLRNAKPMLTGVETGTEYRFGRMVFNERSLSEKDLAGATLTHGDPESAEMVVTRLCGYIERLQPLRIDNIVMLGDCSEESVQVKVVCDTSADFIKRYNVCHCNACKDKGGC
jgi:hypothetical protein